ncbi:MAG: phasin family protein [Sedimentitalea sp.]
MTTKAKTTKAVKDDADTMATKVTEGAREMVKRSTATVKERTDDLYEGSKKYNTQLEDTLKSAAAGYSNILGNFADAAYANLNHTIAAVEKLVEAKSVSEAMQIQADFVREHTTQNMDHARNAFEYVRDVATDTATSVRESYSSAKPTAAPKAA